MNELLRDKIEKETPIVKKFNSGIFIDEMPKKPGKATCEKHGEFEFKYMPGLLNNFICHSSCPKCISERNEFIESEIKRRSEINKQARYIQEATKRGVSKRNLDKTFDNFIAEDDKQRKAKAKCEAFATSVCNGSSTSNLIVCGSVGTGKTHLASATVNKCVRSNKPCDLIKLIDIIRQFKSTWSRESKATEKDVIEYYANLDALIIDEVGVQFGSDTEKMVIFDIIDGRYQNMLPTILISNLGLDEVKELVGDRTIDRLREDGGQVVAMQWESYRVRK